MKNFYIFLDIDGVLTNWNDALKNKEQTRYIMEHGVCKNNIEALNYLVNSISQNFNPVIVITSIRRLNESLFNETLQHINKGLSKK